MLRSCAKHEAITIAKAAEAKANDDRLKLQAAQIAGDERQTLLGEPTIHFGNGMTGFYDPLGADEYDRCCLPHVLAHSGPALFMLLGHEVWGHN